MNEMLTFMRAWAASDPIHEQTCKDNQHPDPVATYPCVQLAIEALRLADAVEGRRE